MAPIVDRLRRIRHNWIQSTVELTVAATPAAVAPQFAELRTSLGELGTTVSELRRILGDQGNAADEVAETLGRVLGKLLSEVSLLQEDVSRLHERLDKMEASR
jgi:hypothetical protein